MYIGAPRRRLSHLWQLPLFMVSASLFAVAAYLFVNARPGLSLNQKLAVARGLLSSDRADAAVEAVSRLMASERFAPVQDAQVHLFLAECLEAQQNQQPQRLPSIAARIIEQTRLAMSEGATASGAMHRRLAQSYETLAQPVEAISEYRQAIAIDPPHALWLRRRVIALQLAQAQWAPAGESIDAYLASEQISDAERAWGCRTKAKLLIRQSEYADAKPLLEQALRLDPDSTAQADAKYHLGLCDWKLGSLDDAKKLIADAREVLGKKHPLDAEATLALGRILLAKNDSAGAIGLFDSVVSDHPDSVQATSARLARGGLRMQSGDLASGAADLKAVAEVAKSSPPDSSLRDETIEAIQKASQISAARDNPQMAIDLLLVEQSLEPSPQASFYSRLAGAYEQRVGELDKALAGASAGERVRLTQVRRDVLVKAGDAEVAFSRGLLAVKDAGYAEPFSKAMDLYDQADAAPNAIGAMELFLADRAQDPVAPDVLLRLAGTYESAGVIAKASSSYERLIATYPKSPDLPRAEVALAMLLLKQPDQAHQAGVLFVKALENPQTARDEELYKQALFELASLNCRSGQWKEASPRLQEFISRFGGDPRMGEAVFLLGECYRDAAQRIDARLASASASADGKAAAGEMERAMTEKMNQWHSAAEQYDRVQKLFAGAPPTREVDQRYQKLADLRRADCAYEQGQYDDAIARYQRVITRWPDDQVAVAASVQVVNSYCAMNKLPEARAANERTRAMLRRLPHDALNGGGLEMPRVYWEQWMKWTATAPSL
jgi:TolA-binding protein